MEKPKTQPINIKYPVELIEKVERFQRKHFFTTRSAAMIYLLSKGLEDIENENKQ
jgi:metal-responsive CopG/Arc/MetJ family transcriptional regulator